MYRRMLLVVLAVSTALGVLVNTGHATPSSLRDTLADRFGLSRIEVQNPSGAGHVIRQGTVLQLQADGIPAIKLRFTQINTKSPRFHSPDYARVEVGQDGRLAANPGELSLPKGTRMVVLGLKVGADRVRLLTHTLEPVRLPDGTTGYGCTEFVFVFDPGTLDRADVAAVASRIDQWLASTSAS
jgi:hypothetical protein